MIQVIGTLLPIAGVVLTFVCAAATSGTVRWVILVGGPITTLALCYTFGEEIGRNGNMLFVALFSLLFIFVTIYYPCLVLYGLVSYFRRRNAHRRNRVVL